MRNTGNQQIYKIRRDLEKFDLFYNKVFLSLPTFRLQPYKFVHLGQGGGGGGGGGGSGP